MFKWCESHYVNKAKSIIILRSRNVVAIPLIVVRVTATWIQFDLREKMVIMSHILQTNVTCKFPNNVWETLSWRDGK